MKKVLVLLFALMMLAAVPAGAAAGKIGVIDVEKVVRVSKAGQALKATLDGKAAGFRDTIMSREKELKKLNADFEKQRIALSKDSIAERERDLQQKVKDLQRFSKDAEEELQQEYRQRTSRILEQVAKVVKGIGSKGGYDLIVEQRNALYAADGIDLTDKVVEAYDKDFSGK